MYTNIHFAVFLHYLIGLCKINKCSLFPLSPHEHMCCSILKRRLVSRFPAMLMKLIFTFLPSKKQNELENWTALCNGVLLTAAGARLCFHTTGGDERFGCCTLINVVDWEISLRWLETARARERICVRGHCTEYFTNYSTTAWLAFCAYIKIYNYIYLNVTCTHVSCKPLARALCHLPSVFKNHHCFCFRWRQWWRWWLLIYKH